MSSHTPLESTVASVFRFWTAAAANASVSDSRDVGSGNVGTDGTVAVGGCTEDCRESAVERWVFSSAAMDSLTGSAPQPWHL